MKDFICAYFGKDWTITARGFGSLKQAESHGKFMMPMAGCFGSVSYTHLTLPTNREV